MVGIKTREFKANARVALDDAQLQRALSGLPGGLVAQRTAARDKLPEFEDLRDVGRDIRDHTLEYLDLYLNEWERKAIAAGAHVHWAPTAADAREIIEKICRDANAKIVTKGKSMVSEEINLNAHLEGKGMEVVETDLGEYLVQIRKETPSHIIAPAIHLTQEEVEKDFRRLHTHLPKDRVLTEPVQLVDEARQILQAEVHRRRRRHHRRQLPNRGNGLVDHRHQRGQRRPDPRSLAKTHVVISTIDRVIPTLEDVSSILRLLARSATGQEFSTYTTFSTGHRRAGDPDGPQNYHVVLLDNGRSELLATEMREILRCIRCGACMNHCPVYNAIGGHAYGWVYPGPIGAVLTPSLIGVKAAGNLPNASTFCGKCESVCPMKIPLPKLMRLHRETEFDLGDLPRGYAMGLKTWAWFARRPRMYHLAARFGMAALGALGSARGAFRSLPFAGGWTKHRDFPAPQGRTFQQLWAESQAGVDRHSGKLSP